MPALAIRAHFPLGVFLGHDADGQPSAYPDTARLHAALLHAAGKGSLAVEVNGDLRPSPDSLSALRWMEAHPPSALLLPEHRFVAEKNKRVMAWRPSQGTVGKDEKKRQARNEGCDRSEAVAVNGPFGWAWDQDAPAEVVGIIDALCQDVSCLGEAEVPAVLEVEDFEPTHWIDQQQTAFGRSGGISMRTPVPGRVDVLERNYATACKKGSAPVDGSGLCRYTYRAPSEPLAAVPWTSGVILPLGAPIAPEDQLRWCVALHRAFAARLGDASLELLTGPRRGPSGRPPRPQTINRVALQYLPFLGPHGSFVALNPRDGRPEDVARVIEAAARLRYIYTSREMSVPLEPARALDAEKFWPAPAPGHTRYWRTATALVSEVRRRTGGSQWDFEAAALLAVGWVWRDRLEGTTPSGSARYSWIVDQVRGWGVTVRDVQPIHDHRVERYVHRMTKGVPAHPYTATVDLSCLMPDTALVAIGQSRHLGGGLLVPADELSQTC